jgi:hypothetical protein
MRAGETRIDLVRQATRLHRELPGSDFISLPGLQPMTHHLDPDAVAKAIQNTVRRSSPMPAL